MSVDEGEDRAKAEQIRFFETSARAGINIKSMLRTTVSEALTSSLSQQQQQQHSSSSGSNGSSHNGGFSGANDTITLTHANTSFQNQQRGGEGEDASCQC